MLKVAIVENEEEQAELLRGYVSSTAKRRGKSVR
jgi:hypothetical protein